jgi:hypothetical protein
MSETNRIPEAFREEIVRACRTTVGDQLRSVTYFDTTGEEQLYLRNDLSSDADIVGFADNERLGFRSQSVYQGSELGEYQFTIRVFDRGYLTRVIVGNHGTFVTTDELSMERFEELASAVRAVLKDHSGAGSTELA